MLCVVALGAGVGALFCAAGSAFARAEVGQLAPSLIVEQLDGQRFNLAQARGKVVIINFWATWCPPCRKEMPALDAVYRRYHDQGLDMIGLSADRSRDRSDVLKVMQSFSYPAAMLGDAEDDGFGDPSELPVTYVVDDQGVVRAELTSNTNPVTEKTLSELVLPLLPQKPAAPAEIH
ncbi:MAG: TlpA disulfide reductase family protein [Candidatus Binataceae bacterium]